MYGMKGGKGGREGGGGDYERCQGWRAFSSLSFLL